MLGEVGLSASGHYLWLTAKLMIQASGTWAKLLTTIHLGGCQVCVQVGHTLLTPHTGVRSECTESGWLKLACQMYQTAGFD